MRYKVPLDEVEQVMLLNPHLGEDKFMAISMNAEIQNFIYPDSVELRGNVMSVIVYPIFQFKPTEICKILLYPRPNRTQRLYDFDFCFQNIPV